MKKNRILTLTIKLCLALVLALGVVPGGNTHAAGVARPIQYDGQIRIPANALNYYGASTVISQYASGLLWKANYVDGAFWTLPRPVDFDGATTVELRLYFYPQTDTAGNVSFFIRPRAYNAGDAFGDATGQDSVPVAVAGNTQIRMQAFSIPAATFGTKDLWAITIQRGGTGETYPDDVVLLAVELRYVRVSASTSQTALPATGLNFDKTSTIITKFGSGLRWQADFGDTAYYAGPRPLDWNGSSDVELRLYFYPLTATAGKVDFFIRPRAYNPGDSFEDANHVDGNAATVGQALQVRMESFSIPAATFGNKAEWMISLQRGGAAETYLNDVVLMAVELRYTHQAVIGKQGGQPANGINYDKYSTLLTQYYSGVRWQASYLNSAVYTVPRPIDWDGISDVELRLYFYAVTATSGKVSFFIRPRAFNVGDLGADAPSMASSGVAVTAANEIRMQTFRIPADRFGTKALWMITLQRGASDETYPDDVVLQSLELRYNRYTLQLPLVKK